MTVVEVSLVDETGVLQVAFFRQPWLAQQLERGSRLAVMGKVEFAYGFKQMSSPHFEKLDDMTAAGDDPAGPWHHRGTLHRLDAPNRLRCA